MVEKPGFFYVGKEFSLKKNKLIDNPILYDSRDLTTHAVCIGMTGSGKTGLCIDIIEEATLNGIPSIIIDPKGDMTNLFLSFPDFQPSDFKEWINPEDARREGISNEEYAKRIAGIWKKGLEEWGIDSKRVRKYTESAEFSLYTPGSKAGEGVSILSSLLAPQLSWESEEETLREKIRGTVSGLLGLIDYDTDPIRSKEHILLSNIFEHFWRKGEDLTLEKLIAAIGAPPFKKLGVLSIDSFIPKHKREKLLLDLNSIIAAPGFEDWIEGAPLDIGKFLWNKKEQPKVSIFYTAHLSDNEKIFFTGLLLEEMLTWVRAQTGTHDLKSILYIDEVYGYMPPYPLNPPTKKPLLLLFKQARAFGTGVMLTTQNPVDIDYKALTNAGTWFIGKLQTERDKDRLLEGLETVIGESGELFDRKYLDQLISSLKKRVFIHHNVHNEKPEIFKTRWAMSYLRGPITKEQIKKLKKIETPTVSRKMEEKISDNDIVRVPPRLIEDFQQYFLPLRYSEDFILKKYYFTPNDIKSKVNVYLPYLFARCNISVNRVRPPVTFSEDKDFICRCDNSREFFLWKELEDSFNADDFYPSSDSDTEIGYRLLNGRLTKKKGFNEAEDKLYIEIKRRKGVVVYYCPELRLYSDREENLESFEARCTEELKQIMDEKMKELQKKYENKMERIRDRIEKKELQKERYEMQASARKREEYLSGAETVLSWIVGRRSMRGLSTASRKRRMRRMSEERVRAAQERIKDYEEDIIRLKQELEDEVDDIEDEMDEALEEIRPIEIKLKNKHISKVAYNLLWIPTLKVDFSEGVKYINMYTAEEIE
jgi:hypothetical protein